MGKKGIPHRKWSKEEKLKIIRLHLDDHISVCDIEKKYGVGNSLVCAWVKKYMEEGEDALEPHNGNGSWHNEFNLVFVDKKGRHLSCMTIYHHFKDIVDSIGRPEMRFHDLRHSYATLSLQTGADVKTVSSQLGHATTAFTLDRYGHTTDRMRQDAADRMSAYIQSLSNNK